MPSYIGFRPQFNPVSLQEYLAVPTMIQQEFDTYEDKYNENLDKLAVLEGMTDESTRYLTDRYKDKLSNAADIIAGKSGSLSDLRSQINNARQYYRETAPRLTNAYNKRQAALKAQQDILLKDPSAVTTKVGNMQSFMDNPDQVFHSLSGDKIYADMINAGKLSAADIVEKSMKVGTGRLAGHLINTIKTGYSLVEQAQYKDLVTRALSGDKNAEQALLNNPIYVQPYTVLSKYIEDNNFNRFSDTEKQYIIGKALSGQLMGMSGNTEEKYLDDKVWAAAQKDSVSDSKGRSKKEDDLYKYFMSQSLPSPDYDSESKSNKDKSVASKVLAGPVTNNNKTIQTVLNTVGNITGIKPYSNFSETKTYEGALSASADFYNNEANRTKAANQSNNQLVSSLNETFGRNVRESYVKFNDKSLNTIRQYGKSNFARYKTVDEIPENVKTQFVNSLKTANYTAGMIPSNPTQEQINLLVDIGFSGMQNTTRRATAPNSSYLTEKEFNDLKRKGVQFYNQDGSVRDERDILWDAWDIIMPKQYDKYSITTTQGAGKNYGVSATKEYLDEFPNSGNVKTTSGETVQLKPNKDRTGFVGYGDPQYYLSGRTIRQGKKIMTITSDSGDTTRTIDIPLSRREKNIINNQVKDMRAEWLTALVSKGIMSMEEATIIKNYSVPDFLKFVELVNQYPNLYGGRWSGLVPNINEIIDELDDALVIGNEVNFIQSNSETEGKLYN